MSQRTPPVVIGIAGGTGSGKTTVATVILERSGAENIVLLPHDAYYKDLSSLPQAQRELVNFDHPDSLETALMVEHLAALRRWQAVDIPVYDFSQHARTQDRLHLEPQPIVLVEGILVFAEPELRALFDVKIFVDTPPDIRFIGHPAVRDHRAAHAPRIRRTVQTLRRCDHPGGRPEHRRHGHGRRPNRIAAGPKPPTRSIGCPTVSTPSLPRW